MIADLNVLGGGMTAEIVVGLVDHDLMVTAQVPSGGEAGDAGADDGNSAHDSLLSGYGAGSDRVPRRAPV